MDEFDKVLWKGFILTLIVGFLLISFAQIYGVYKILGLTDVDFYKAWILGIKYLRGGF